MAQNTYISLQQEEIDGMLIRSIERAMEWQKSEAKLKIERRRAIVFFGYATLKLWCWHQADNAAKAEDIDEISHIEGFTEALLSVGFAVKRDDGFIVIERFSPQNIVKRNRLTGDSQRKRLHRIEDEKEENVCKKEDARPDSSSGAIDNDKQYNKQYDKTYNKNRKYNNSYSSQRDDKIPESNTSAYYTGTRCVEEPYSIKNQQTAKLSPEARVERLALQIESQTTPDDGIPF